MLVLSRKVAEQIVIEVPPSDQPRQIVVTQVRIGQVTSRIGIDAPLDVNIVRGELIGVLECGKPACQLSETSDNE